MQAKNVMQIQKTFPITWAALLHMHSVGKDGEVIQFINTSFREIDINGDFGEDPIPPPDPIPDPTIPDPDPDPPTYPGHNHLTRSLHLQLQR